MCKSINMRWSRGLRRENQITKSRWTYKNDVFWKIMCIVLGILNVCVGNYAIQRQYHF